MLVTDGHRLGRRRQQGTAWVLWRAGIPRATHRRGGGQSALQMRFAEPVAPAPKTVKVRARSQAGPAVARRWHSGRAATDMAKDVDVRSGIAGASCRAEVWRSRVTGSMHC